MKYTTVNLYNSRHQVGTCNTVFMPNSGHYNKPKVIGDSNLNRFSIPYNSFGTFLMSSGNDEHNNC